MTLTLARFLGVPSPSDVSMVVWTVLIACLAWWLRGYAEERKAARLKEKLWSGERMR